MWRHPLFLRVESGSDRDTEVRASQGTLQREAVFPQWRSGRRRWSWRGCWLPAKRPHSPVLRKPGAWPVTKTGGRIPAGTPFRCPRSLPGVPNATGFLRSTTPGSRRPPTPIGGWTIATPWCRDGRFRDNQTGTTWNLAGLAIAGELSGTRLTPVPHGNHFWFAWVAFRPDTELWKP